MIGEWIRFGLAALCVLAGCFALLTAIVGLFRFDFSLNRLHAASIADTLGLSLLVLAVMLAKAVLAAKAALQVWLVKAVQAAARMLRLCNSKTLSACSILNLS